jgi:hypothetical protein
MRSKPPRESIEIVSKVAVAYYYNFFLASILCLRASLKPPPSFFGAFLKFAFIVSAFSFAKKPLSFGFRIYSI